MHHADVYIYTQYVPKRVCVCAFLHYTLRVYSCGRVTHRSWALRRARHITGLLKARAGITKEGESLFSPPIPLAPLPFGGNIGLYIVYMYAY